ncbi:MAG: hypothetical protein A2W25_15220 [candidate division Zixibacteria bacterium RBG_16_53_22]|nr:MAG: hypothetical protein A2W25_15220 [candidate division Zixibacteria bacterium RBG_16_53_22]
MSTIITWVDVTARYAEMDKLPNGTSPEVQANLILMAEASVHSRLASRYAVPFSSSNYTARDLAVDTLYVQAQLTRQPEKAQALQESIDARITALVNGQANMIDATGAAVATMVGDTIWSSSENYPPVFGVGDIAKAEVSSEQLLDEATTRGEFTV